MIDDHETCILYRERLFDRVGHTFRLIVCKDHGETWVSNLQIKTPFEAHLYATHLMDENALEYQIWILDETANDGVLPLLDIWDRYNAIILPHAGDPGAGMGLYTRGHWRSLDRSLGFDAKSRKDDKF